MASKLVFVQFIKPVSIGGQFSTLEYWSSEKHGGIVDCAERGDWIHLTFGEDSRRRVPMANVAFMSDKILPDAKK